MRSAIGFVVLAVGLGFGAIAYFPQLGVPSYSTPWAMLTPAEAALAGSPRASYNERVAQFSEGAALLVAENDQVQFDAGARLPLAGRKPADSAGDAALRPWRSAVITEPSGFGADGNQVRADRLDPREKAKVAAEIQAELSRVGCYAGEIDGVWGGASRTALATFLGRVNAALPTSEPDVILLTLIRAQPAGTCGVDCPAGQDLDSASNQCVPSAILAQSTKRRSVKPTALASANAPVSVPAYRDPLPGRMSVGAYTTTQPRDAEGSNSGSGPSSYMRTAALEPSAAVAQGQAAPPPAATSSYEKPTQRAATASAPEPQREKRAASSRPQRVSSASWRASRSGYRSVQRLFENPLGRL